MGGSRGKGGGKCRRVCIRSVYEAAARAQAVKQVGLSGAMALAELWSHMSACARIRTRTRRQRRRKEGEGGVNCRQRGKGERGYKDLLEELDTVRRVDAALLVECACDVALFKLLPGPVRTRDVRDDELLDRGAVPAPATAPAEVADVVADVVARVVADVSTRRCTSARWPRVVPRQQPQCDRHGERTARGARQRSTTASSRALAKDCRRGYVREGAADGHLPAAHPAAAAVPPGRAPAPATSLPRAALAVHQPLRRRVWFLGLLVRILDKRVRRGCVCEEEVSWSVLA